MRLIETPWHWLGSSVKTFSLRASNFEGLVKRKELASRLKPTTTNISFENSSLDSLLEFFRWFNHVKEEVLTTQSLNNDMSPRVCDDELLDNEQNRLNFLYGIEFSNCHLIDSNSRLNVEVFKLFGELRSIKFYNCKFDGILFSLMLDNLKSLTNLHTLSFVGCELDSINVAKLIEIVDTRLNNLAVFELKQRTPVTSLVEKKIEHVFLSENSKVNFQNLIGCNIFFQSSNDFSMRIYQSVESYILIENRSKINWVMQCINNFLNDYELPFDEDFFRVFYNCKSSIFHQMTSPSAGNRMLSPLHMKGLFAQIVEALWEKFFSRYLVRDDDVYLEAQDLYDNARDKIIHGDLSNFNEVVDDLVDLTSNRTKLLSYLEDLKNLCTAKKRFFALEHVKRAIISSNDKLDLDIAYS